jgi:hypothetical protein
MQNPKLLENCFIQIKNINKETNFFILFCYGIF